MINIKLESDKSFKQVRSIKTNIHMNYKAAQYHNQYDFVRFSNMSIWFLPPIADIVCENELQQAFLAKTEVRIMTFGTWILTYQAFQSEVIL